jgi:signal peptidase II
LIKKFFIQYPQFKSISIIFLFVFILDQVTKALARIYLQPVHSVSIMGDFLRLTFVENPGIAFGVSIDNKILFTLLSIIAVIIIFYYLFKLKDQITLRYAFALILGGAIGNLLDRFLYSTVVDFIDVEFFNINIPSFDFLIFHFEGYLLDRWPVFNIADMAVTTGMIIIVINAFLDSKKKDSIKNESQQ